MEPTQAEDQDFTQVALVIISNLYAEGRINDEDRDKLKGNISHKIRLTQLFRHGIQ